MNGSLPDGQKILKEIGSSANATKEDIHLYAEHLGIVLPDEQNLLWIAQAGLEVSLPPPWCPVEDPQGRIYYYNSVTKETKWEHPLDSYYKAVVKKERLKACARTTTAESNVEDSGASLASLVQQTDTDSESHTATLRNQDEPAVVQDLLTQKQALEFELERLKREVHKYQRIRDQLKASAKQELIQLGTTSLVHRSRNHKHAIADEKQGQNSQDKGAALLGDTSGTKTKGESSKPSKGAATGSLSSRSSLGHKDLLRLSQRLSHLRHRHLQLSLRAAQQVAEDALARLHAVHVHFAHAPGVFVSTNAFVEQTPCLYSQQLVPSSSTDLVPHRTARALTDTPHVEMDAVHGTAPTHYLKTYVSQQHDGRPPQQWSRSEWTTKLSQLRWSLRECELQQLLIK
ncbi:hypothetical protein HPB52_013704 [Rhipicephalus sanguineus]|uniref:WW domain-containing protein n=1 Tax=Rhipicephalus sanguineus TaxID=34632 RepID=A0A9D4T3S5_RHISA|nr:hypothetical protein HPB52_013704 [Rhipicephalus sanguineus]